MQILPHGSSLPRAGRSLERIALSLFGRFEELTKTFEFARKKLDSTLPWTSNVSTLEELSLMNCVQISDPALCTAALHTEQQGLILQSFKECPVSQQLIQLVGVFLHFGHGGKFYI